MRKPQLIDSLKDSNCSVQLCVTDKSKPSQCRYVWFIAKPVEYGGWLTLKERLYHAWLVLTGRASAVSYAEDYYHQDECNQTYNNRKLN